MQFNKGKINFISNIDWVTKGVIKENTVNETLKEIPNPYYVVIDNGESGGIIGYVSSKIKLKKQYSIGAFLISELRENLDDSFIYICKIEQKAENYYVLNYDLGQIEFDGSMTKKELRGLIGQKKSESKIIASKEVSSLFSEGSKVRFYDIEKHINDGINDSHKLRALSELYNNIKTAILVIIVISLIGYFGPELYNYFFSKKEVNTGPTKEQLLKFTKEKERKAHEAYVAAEIKKRTSDISPKIGYESCEKLINEMPLNIAGWKKGTYGCKNAKGGQVASVGFTRIAFAFKPNEFQYQAENKGFSSTVMFDTNKNLYSATVIHQSKEKVKLRKYLEHKDLVPYDFVMNQINVNLINAFDNRCTLKRYKEPLPPQDTKKPIPKDLEVFITKIDLSCSNSYLKQIRKQLEIFDRQDINFVFFNMLEKKFKLRYQFISKT